MEEPGGHPGSLGFDEAHRRPVTHAERQPGAQPDHQQRPGDDGRDALTKLVEETFAELPAAHASPA
ncbi:hypothetical protein [Actinoallomurus sp. NPDC052274]|uniref:hypothetical protein n=1 Tax=Actinoallomurus sp. NPDC052274 TaxID=3155420 RepID=UPI003443B2F5